MKFRQFALPLIISVVMLVVGIAALQYMSEKDKAEQVTGIKTAPIPAAGQSSQSNQNQQAGSLDQMVIQLETRLQDQGGTADDWILLGKTYQYLGRSEDAEMAYSRAGEMGYDPERLKQAKQDMTQQLNSPPPRLSQPSGKMNSLEVAALNQKLFDSNNGKTSENAAVSIKGTLTLSKELQDKLPNQATLFIFARGAEPGQAAPYAVIKTQDLTFPMSFELNNNHAVMPGRNLSSTTQVVIGARISISGDASGQRGDLEGNSQPVLVSLKQPIALEINKIRR